MAAGDNETGWHFDDVRKRLDFYYRGTRIGHLNASGFSLVSGAITNDVIQSGAFAALSVDTADIALLAVDTAQLAALAVTTAKIAAGAVTSPKLGNGLIQFQDTQLNAAAVNGLAAANVEVVSAPAAGLAVDPIAVHMFLDHGGTDFVQTNGADHLALLYNGGSEILEIGLEATLTTFLEASADAALYWELLGYATAAGGRIPLAATAIDLDNNGAAEYATGDGTLSIRVYYRVLPMAAFS